MRIVVAVLLFLLMLSGCLGAEEQAESGDVPGPTDETPWIPPALPEDINRSIEVTAGFDIPLPAGEEEFCWMVTHACDEASFTVERANVTIQAEIEWSNTLNNFGVFIYQGDEVLAYSSGPDPNGTNRSLSYTFQETGEYRLVVDAHWAVADTAELRAGFTWGSS